MNDKISIVMPCFKAQQYVADVVGDVMKQSYPYWELIAVSNGQQQQQQLDILDSWAKKDKKGRIKVISVEKGNVSNARNIGIENATGKWITFVDVDDRLMDCHLQRYIDSVGNDSPDVVCGGITEYWVKENRINTRPLKNVKGREAKRYLLMQEPIMVNSVWNKMFLAEFLKNSGVHYKEIFTQSQDAIYVRELLLKTDNIALFNLSGYKYMHHRVQTNSMSRYHACFNLAVKEKRRLLDELMRQVGFTQKEIMKSRNDELYTTTYQCFFNLFRTTCPLSFKEKNAEVKSIVFEDKEKLNIIRKQDRSKHNRAQRIFDMFCDWGSSWAMTAFYHCGSSLCYSFWPLFQKLYPLLHKK